MDIADFVVRFRERFVIEKVQWDIFRLHLITMHLINSISHLGCGGFLEHSLM